MEGGGRGGRWAVLRIRESCKKVNCYDFVLEISISHIASNTRC